MARQEVVDNHQCSICSCDYTDDEGGIQGNFGMLSVSFCPTCFSCMCDMAAQYLDIGEDGEPNTQHDELIQHLKGFRDIVINNCHGGFGLSRDAEIAWLERSKIPYTTVSRDDRHSTDRWGPHILVNNQHWNSRHIARDDPVLVSLVQELGKASHGEHAQLKVVRIPADAEWFIQEYDGNEWVAEAHRSWK
jgi:hypothetical protein